MLALKTQKRKVAEQQRQAHERILGAVEEAKRWVRAKQKARAQFALKKKKLLEGKLARVDGLLMQIEEQLIGLEQAKQQNEIFAALKRGTAALKSIQDKVTVEAVEKVLEETEEAYANQQEIDGLLRDEFGAEVEGDLLSEFQALEESLHVEGLPEVPGAPLPAAAAVEELPEAPTREVAVAGTGPGEEPEEPERVMVPA